MENVIDTVASQYANSPTLRRLIDNMNEYFDPSTNFQDFYDFVWNIDTAQGFGLDIWGRIVNVSRELTIPNGLTFFGFHGAEEGAPTPITLACLSPRLIGGRSYLAPETEVFTPDTSGDDVAGFGQAPFLERSGASQTYRLDDDAYRALILIKALYNISNSSAACINQLLRNLFPNRGNCYVRDDGGMQITFVFEFILRPYELAILQQSGAVPRPAGVKSAILQVSVASTFGFMEANGQPFGSGVFFN